MFNIIYFEAGIKYQVSSIKKRSSAKHIKKRSYSKPNNYKLKMIPTSNF